jgi:hypothetical protein
MSISRAASVLTNVATSTASATVFNSNTAARGRVVWNDSAAILYLAYSATAASATAATTAVAAGATWTFDSGLYTGTVTGILASGTGFARVTEY